MSVNFNGKKDLIGMLILLLMPAIFAISLAILLPFIRNGKLPVVLIVLAVVLLVYLYKLKKNKKSTP